MGKFGFATWCRRAPEAPCPLIGLASVQLEEQLSRLQREKNEIQSRLEEDQEDMNELMKKHKAAVAQVPHHTPHHRRWPSGPLPKPLPPPPRHFSWESRTCTLCAVWWAGVCVHGGSCFSTHSFPRPRGTWHR